jgi:hypothetical protein
METPNRQRCTAAAPRGQAALDDRSRDGAVRQVGVREARAQVLTAAYAAAPERFVNKAPTPPELPGVAWINRPEPEVASNSTL